jgi:mRNA interferase RelE/StbE
VSLTVVFRETALRNLARIRNKDKGVFARTRPAITLLADQPYPEGAVAWGATGVYRLHSGDIRVLYEVDEEAAAVLHHQHRSHLLNPIACPCSQAGLLGPPDRQARAASV